MLGLERDIGIEIADDVEFEVFDSIIARIEGMHFPGKVPFLTLWHSEQFNPGMIDQVSTYNLVSSIG
jgi:hypothetical protein